MDWLYVGGTGALGAGIELGKASVSVAAESFMGVSVRACQRLRLECSASS
jgi:hypothetical protein